MDFPGVQWQDHAAQKWIGLEPEEKDRFITLQDIDEVFRSAQHLTTQDDLDFLQSISASYSVQKDGDGAAKCREKGNSSFKARNYTEAALHYSQGICLAPQSSEQLSLCYANRSAALHHLQLYQECLDDIDSSLKNGYPSHLQHKLEDRRTSCLKYLCVSEKPGEKDGNSSSKSRKCPDRAKTPSAPAGVCPAASAVSNVEKGRHLVAVERIAAGEVILVDSPYSCVLIPGRQEVKGRGREDAQSEGLGTETRRCHWCLAETLRLIPCDSCSYSRYCSPSCQREAWREHHQWECPLGADLKVTGVMSQLALRVTLKAGLKNIQRAREPIRDEKQDLSSFNSDSFKPDDSYLSVFHLLHHLHHHSPSLRFLCAFTVAVLYQRLSQAGPPPTSWKPIRPSTPKSQSPDRLSKAGSDAGWSSDLWPVGGAVLRHMLQLRCNAQAVLALQDTGAANSSVQSSREVRIATAIFPTLSLLNHACRPNTSLAFSTGTRDDAHGSEISTEDRQGVTVTVRAAKAISPGQEILHCYGPHSSRMLTPERQRLLQEQYFFLCQCDSCSSQQPQEEGEEEEEEEGESKSQRSGAGGGPQGSGLLCSKCKGYLKKSSDKRGFLCSESSCGRHISSSEVSNSLQGVRVQLEKAVDLLERDRPGEALKLLKRTQSQSGRILAETHPLWGELADAMARAYATKGDWNNAASQLERSTVAIASQYGEDSIELGQQLFKLAQLHFNGGARGAALSVIPEVRRLLCLHRGHRCPEMQELKAMEDCLQG